MPADVRIQHFATACPICDELLVFTALDDFWEGRDGLAAASCGLGGCTTRERAVASVLRSLYPGEQLRTMVIHESSATPHGLARWLRTTCPGYVATGYFPDIPRGEIVRGVRNEDLYAQTFADGTFDLVLHLDVLEHLFEPFAALREIARTLASGGACVFTAPTDPARMWSEQVAFREPDGLRIVGEPEYHGNPHGDGALVTWRYGYDLPLRIQQETGLDVEVRRFQSRTHAAMGLMTEVYILRRSSATDPSAGNPK
jgi:SAM-dependent methyltransferase